MTSLKSGVKLTLMKKLSLYIFLVLMFCNVGFAECIKGDCINGYGTYVWGDGTKYVGGWKKGKSHGQGTYTFTDGRVVKGIWKDGKKSEKAKKKKTSSPSSKEAKLIKQMAEDDENLTKKQAKCLIKKTKPLVKKEDWNKWMEVMLSKDKDKMSRDDLEILFDVGYKMMAHSSECGVPIG